MNSGSRHSVFALSRTLFSITQVIALTILLSGIGRAQLNSINYFPTELTLSGITAGPDGGLWFQASFNGTDAIGEMSIVGQVTNLYTVPWAGSSFNRNGITTGADGNIWFLDDGANSVGVVCLKKTTVCPVVGTIAPAIPIPTPNSRPYSIVSGPDGALWFTEIAGGKIGRISIEGGTPSEYSAGIGSSPYDIVPGTDGKSLWFTDNSGNYVDQIIAATGVVTPYPVPTPNSLPASLTIGPDGAIWFSESGASKITKFTPGRDCGKVAGVSFCEHNSPMPQPGELAVGADAAIWVVQQLGTPGYIGRVAMDGTGTSFPT